MEKGYKGKNLYRYFMMRGKTLAVLGALGILGVAAYSQGAPTIGQLAQSMKSQPTSWTVVVGANAKAADVVGASNIIAALETFTVPSTQNVTVSVSSTSTSQVPSGVYPFYSSQAPLYLGSYINSVYPVLQVGSGSFQINGQTYTYEAYVEPASDQITFNNFGSGSNYIPAVGIYAGSNGQLLTLAIYFTPGINVASLATNPQQITILGTTYYLSYNTNNGYMNLVPAANTLTLNVGQSATVDGLTIQLTNVVKNQQGIWYAVLNINGQSYTIQVGTSQVVNGVNVYVANAFASVLTSSNVSAGYAIIVVSQGGYQFPLSTSATSVLTSSGTPVSGVTVSAPGYSNQELTELLFTFSLTSTQPNGQYALLAGQSYQLPVFSGYELYVAPVQLPTGPLALQLTPSGYTQYTLQYVDAVTGNTVSIPLYGSTSTSNTSTIYLFSSSSSSTFVGTITNNYNVVPGASSANTLPAVGSAPAYILVAQGQYFAVVDADLQQTYIFQVQSINTASTPASATLYNYVTGQTLTVYNNTPIVIGSITLVPNITTSNGQWVVGFNAPSTLYYSTSGLTLYEGYNKYVQVGGINTASSTDTPAQATVTFYDNYGNSRTSRIQLTLSYNNSEFISLTPSVSTILIGSNTYGYMDSNGVYLVETTSSSSNPTIQLYAPSQPLTINVGLAPSGYTPSTTSTSTTQTVTVSVPTPSALIGKVILDTQVTPSMSDLILVGGPAVNTLTAQAVIQYVSSMNATLGQELQSYANSQNGYIYGSELAPVLQQLGIPFGPGMALIMSSTLYPNTLVIFGWYGNDTTQATELFANYLVNGVDSSVFNNATVVEVNDQQTVNGYPAATQIQ